MGVVPAPHSRPCLPAQKAVPIKGPRGDRGESPGLPEGRCVVSPCANLSAADLGQPAICKMRPDSPGEFCLVWGADSLSANTPREDYGVSGWPGCLSWVRPFLHKRPGGLHDPLSPRQHSASLSPLTIHVSYVSLSNDPRDSAAASVCTHTHTTHTLTHTRVHTHRHTHAHTRAHTCTPTHTGHTHKGTQARTQAHPGQTSTSTPIPCLDSKPAGLLHLLGKSHAHPHPCPLALCSAWSEGSLRARH